MHLASSPIQSLLATSGVVVLDGALATELERRGADLNDPLWSARLLIERPDLVREVHRDYFLAGADVATTASYQATFAGFAGRGIDAPQAARLLQLSVQLAKEAREEFLAVVGPRANAPLVAASCGCYGAALHDGSEYRGDYGLSRQQLIDFHRPRLEALLDGQPDLLAFETIPCLIEVEAIVRLLDEFPQVSAWVSFSCRDDVHVCHGEGLRDCLAVAESSPQVAAVGINCTAPRFVNGLLDSVAGHVQKPLIVYPNRGETWDAKGHCWQPGPDMPGNWGQAAKEWHARGARIIGGCCRTTPDDICSVRQALTEVHRHARSEE